MGDRYPHLSVIDTPDDLRRVPEEDLPFVADEIRDFLIETVSQTGGHFASGLGAVELTIALHYVLDTPRDLIVWDVGHQCYPHKILTGRRDQFHTLRQDGGISGFLKRDESPFDVFEAGHASTSISAALGMAAARDAAGEDHQIVAVIGDGGLSGGMAMEGLNQAGYLRRRMIVVLNDNDMSIAPNVGALRGYLNRIVAGQPYKRFKEDVEGVLRRIPGIGDQVVQAAKKLEQTAKQLMVPGLLFEELGFKYVGPVNGHSLPQLVQTLTAQHEATGPVLIHAVTQKGKGYRPAESNPEGWHGAKPFTPSTGKVNSSSSDVPSYTKVFSETLVDLARDDDRLQAITAAMPEGTGLDRFAAEYPDRFFDVGICEQHAVTFAGGMAARGLQPVCAIYSTFLQRAFDQIFHDVCLMNLPVVFAVDRAGLVGADGPTHHGTFDLSYLRMLPNMVVMAPKDEDELRHMLITAVRLGRPCAVRYPRGTGLGVPMQGPPTPLEFGRGELLREGDDGTIWAIGVLATESLRAAERLSDTVGIELSVVNARFVKPIDYDLLEQTVRPDAPLLTVEENAVAGGFGAAVAEALEEIGRAGVRLERLGIPDAYQPHGSQATLRRRLDLDSEGIASRARRLVEGRFTHVRRAGVR